MSSRQIASRCAAAFASRGLSDAALALVAGRFAVLSDPLRLRLVHLLFEREKSVHELVAESGGSQGNVSRHLQTLAAAGVLGRRREGHQVFYAIADPTVHPLCDLVCGSLEKQLVAQARVFTSERA